MRRLANGMRLQEWGPDLVIKAFDDLDIVFFRGVLDTRTQIEWRTDEEIAGRTGDRVLGLLVQCSWGRRRLPNKSSKDTSTSSAMKRTRSPIDHAMGEAWSVGGHAQAFRRIIAAIDDRFRKYFNMSAISAGESFRLVPCGSNRQSEGQA
ncbi:MAG: hypothetical protein Q9226_001007 [Calogaya cf. arnoldii]